MPLHTGPPALSEVLLPARMRAARAFFRQLLVPELGDVWFGSQLPRLPAVLVLHEQLESPGHLSRH